MAKLVLAAVVPTVVTAASALAFWLVRNCNDSSSSDDSTADSGIIPPNASLSTAAADELSIISWNVLADTFAAKLDYATAEELDWSMQRWPLIKDSLLCWGADLVLLQEVDVVW